MHVIIKKRRNMRRNPDGLNLNGRVERGRGASTKNQNVMVLIGVAVMMVLSACTQPVGDETGAAQEKDLPVRFVAEDEEGPADITGLVSEASSIFEAELVDVRGGLRYYGPDEEAPDALVFEQVELIFRPTRVYKGDPNGDISVRWTSYIAAKARPNAQRLEQVSINGLVVNEKAKGQRYGVFIGEELSEGLFDPLTSEGLVPLNPTGKVTGRQGGASGMFEAWVGKPFADAISE